MPDIPIHCAYDELAAVETLVPNPRNPNRHPDRQIELLARVIEHQGVRGYGRANGTASPQTAE